MSLNMIDGETDLLDLSYRGLLSYDERYKLSGKLFITSFHKCSY